MKCAPQFVAVMMVSLELESFERTKSAKRHKSAGGAGLHLLAAEISQAESGELPQLRSTKFVCAA
jgi:hypothetical protein